MAKYLRTSSITAELENLIRDARKELYIISPYLKLSDHIKELLNDKEREKVDVRIIFGKQELAPTEMSYLEDLKYVRLYFSKNLHAKCYLNESKMIIASMNLYEFSQQNNREMGILIDIENEEDKNVYEDAAKDIESIIHNSEDFSYVKAPQKEFLRDSKKTKTTENSLPKNKNFKQKDYSKSNYKTTKELSEMTGISSRKINSSLKKNGFMIKKDDDWFATTKGEEFGGLQKEGQYGKFIVWPEEIIDSILK
ncbi:phospholipase D family protein [Christiangramia sp. OXR-203]|uniref:phospholipase D family protein n=1 Tax=Christiangramia sp. OXR-203 TaxID=3100176 RepID=UPI002AC8E218|nr:phospholipase D family protein [Christiangramia sp. OXR-203]WPY97618.1 phospholipase D family protein [Christiangramia sp. OXR-203]